MRGKKGAVAAGAAGGAVVGGRLPLFGLPLAPPTLIEEVWVQCDKPNCKKWRKLPLGVKAPPDNVEWFCSMNPDPNRNRCDLPEEAYDDDDWEAREAERKKQQELQQQQQAAMAHKPKQLPTYNLQQLNRPSQLQQQPHPQQLMQQHYADHEHQGAAARRRRSGELQQGYAAADYEWDYGAGKKRKRRSTGPPQQLPKFFANQQEEQQQLQVACQRILDNKGLWDTSAAPSGSRSSSSSSSHTPNQFGLPVWVWNGMHTYAPQAATVLVEALNLATSSISVGLQSVPAIVGGPAGGSNQQQQQQQQEDQGMPSSPPVKQQQVTVVEQRWCIAQLAMLAAAATTLAALRSDSEPTQQQQELKQLDQQQPVDGSSHQQCSNGNAAAAAAEEASGAPGGSAHPATAQLLQSDQPLSQQQQPSTDALVPDATALVQQSPGGQQGAVVMQGAPCIQPHKQPLEHLPGATTAAEDPTGHLSSSNGPSSGTEHPVGKPEQLQQQQQQTGTEHPVSKPEQQQQSGTEHPVGKSEQQQQQMGAQTVAA